MCQLSFKMPENQPPEQVGCKRSIPDGQNTDPGGTEFQNQSVWRISIEDLNSNDSQTNTPPVGCCLLQKPPSGLRHAIQDGIKHAKVLRNQQGQSHYMLIARVMAPAG